MTEAARPQRGLNLAVLGWVVFVLLVVYAVLIGGGFAGIYLVQLRTISLVLVAAGLVVWLLLSIRDARWRPSTAVWPTLVLPIGGLALATVASAWPRLGVEYVAWAVLLVALYLLLVRVLATQTARDRIGGLATILALVVGVLYLATVVQTWIEWWGLVGRLQVPPLRPLYGGLSLGGPGSVQTVQVLATAIAIAALGVGDRRRQSLAAVLLAITAAVVVVSASRSGWGALVGSIIITSGLWAVLAMRSGSLRERFAERWAQRGIRMAIGGAVVGAVIAAIVVGPVILGRMLNSGTGGREQYFNVALRMFGDEPLLGQGPGTWAVRRVAYTEPGELDHYIPHAHDVYLQTLAELGLVGALVGILAALPVVWLIARALGSDSAARRRWAWCVVFVLSFLGLVALFDFQMNVPAVMLLGVLPVAWLDGASDRGIGLGSVRGAAATWIGRIAIASLWVGCLAAVLALARIEAVASTHDRAVTSVFAADWESARAPAIEAYENDRDYPAYAITRGLVASADQDWDAALEAYRFAAEIDDISQSWLGAAQALHALEARPEEVVTAIENALRIGEQQPSVVFAAGHLYDRLGLSDRADVLYAETIARYPSLADDPYWERLDERYDDIVRAAAERTSTNSWEVALIAGDADQARSLAAADATAASIVEAWAGDEEALAAVLALADDAPESAYLLSWASRLASRAGDVEEADRYQRLAVFRVTEGGELPGTEVRIDEHGYLDALMAGSEVGYAGHYLYRRPLSPDLLPPGLPRLVFTERVEEAVADDSSAPD